MLSAFYFLLFPLLIGYVYSVIKNPVLQNSVPVFTFPYLLLLLGSFLPLRVNKPAGSVLVASVLVLCIYTSEKMINIIMKFKFIAEKTVE